MWYVILQQRILSCCVLAVGWRSLHHAAVAPHALHTSSVILQLPHSDRCIVLLLLLLQGRGKRSMCGCCQGTGEEECSWCHGTGQWLLHQLHTLQHVEPSTAVSSAQATATKRPP